MDNEPTLEELEAAQTVAYEEGLTAARDIKEAGEALGLAAEALELAVKTYNRLEELAAAHKAAQGEE